MSPDTILGLAGDSLTFVGGFILALDALLRQKEFRKRGDLGQTVTALKGVRLVQDGIKLVNNDDVELVFIRQSVRRALVGATILTIGFVLLLSARIAELTSRVAEHGISGP